MPSTMPSGSNGSSYPVMSFSQPLPQGLSTEPESGPREILRDAGDDSESGGEWGNGGEPFASRRGAGQLRRSDSSDPADGR